MKKIFGAIAVAILAVIGAALIPSTAQAHTGDMNISAVCNPATGQYDFTVSLTTANTGLPGETRWRVGTGSFEGTPASAAGMDRGPVASSGAQTVTLGSFSLPGNTTGLGPWVYAHTTWSDGYAKGSDGQLRAPLAGDCKIPEPPFEGVTAYTPSHSATCEAASYSHPAIKTGLGIANVYGVRYGIAQADAQAKPFEPYTPGTVVTMPFADPYADSSYYFELKVGYDGATLTHQIGQTRGLSTACERPVPEQPADLVGDEIRDLEPVCTVPADGTAEIVSEKRTWSQTHLWNAEAWEWQLSEERSYSEWEQSGSMVVDLSDCEPEVVIPPTIGPPTETPAQLPVKPTVVQTAALASTGFGSEALGWIAIALVALGLGVAGSRLVRGSAVKSEEE